MLEKNVLRLLIKSANKIFKEHLSKNTNEHLRANISLQAQSREKINFKT